MTTAVYLAALLAVLGAVDTLYFHEWRARLPAMGRGAGIELKLHAFRDFVYSLIFATLPWIGWHGWFALILAFLLLT